jgi:PTH1 family peptidyl-tRNA hydrolase
MSQPRLIVGLGNPKSSYDETRHNIGKRFIEFLFSRLKVSTQHEGPGVLAEVTPLHSEASLPIYAATLTSFMNESGGALKRVADLKAIKPEEMLIIVDDFMIPFGSLRVRTKGSSGGHNGLKSVEEVFGTSDYPRLRVGIGPVPGGQDPADFVLEDFTKAEEEKMTELFERIKTGVELIFRDGYAKAMNEINK